MANKKQKLDYSAMNDGKKQWKISPPGIEQKELEKLFESNEIDEYMSPSFVQRKYEIFKPFSQKVFASHFRQVKAKLGLFSKFSYNFTI